ncbi:AMIN domain-containing protein [Desulfopila sp. IMCC35006]|uniref:N-acetylmuramoyl-L-alanine amidase n=1 Tax=Desulfopila sp. IMCC35006 TaxID=2569542 RepID=UPI0010AC1B53|nr:N-acetylmuramoyl-L-alanine amidase [Desulfopila sp. IMCC35006]TKB24919.1 AMIN domain-containing protein [Desulfopila sp. IMCC35006]
MSSRPIFLYLAIVLQLLLLPFDLLAAGHTTWKQQPPADRYNAAKSYYQQLQTDTGLSASRDNWLKGARDFRRIYLSSPKTDLAPACLYMLGRMYGDMHDHFHNSNDLNEAISYFKDTARLFPRHRLADDAYFALAQLYLDKKNDPRRAADPLIEIVNKYPKSDMRPQAEELLKGLSRENDIALPKSILSSFGHNKLSDVLPVKYWSSDNYTRVVIKSSAPVSYKDFQREETPKALNKLYIDFNKSYIAPQYRAPVPIKGGLLRGIHTAQLNPDTVRVVLDLQSIGDYKIFNLPNPFRVVIDVRGESKKSAQLPSGKIVGHRQDIPGITEHTKKRDIAVLRGAKKIVLSPSPSKNEPKIEEVSSSAPLSLAQQLGLGVRKIILDPGHGGKDPGAMAFGLKEKDIVLDLATKLAPILEKELHCQVILTRNQDVFIPLEERTAIANTQNGDLFVSLHVNAHPSAQVRGLETYYLNLSTNAEAMRVAALENATSTHQMSDLQDILSDIMKNSKISESSRLAQQVHSTIVEGAKSNGYADIKNLGVKQAPFYVLIGAQMPAILIEVAFISNEQDSQNLQDPRFMTMITEQIASGIRAYVSKTTAQLSLDK